MKAPWTTGTLAGIALVLVVCSSNINWGKDHWRTVIQADAKGYYAYLPALFIYHDANLGFFDGIEKGTYYDPNRFYDYRFGYKGKVVDKYFLGTAVAQLPFFLAAHGYAAVTGGLTDGYSKPYVVGVNLAAVAWVLFGLWCMARLLSTYEVPDGWIAFTLVVFMFGTNLFYYAIVAPGMSHAYSFGLCTAFLLLGRRTMTAPSTGRILALGALLGLIILIRPVNALLLLALPILLDDRPSWPDIKKAFTRYWTIVCASGLLAMAVAALQLLYYRIATGDWIVYSYGEEGFHWSDPHVLDILFSYRKGLFLYTPVLLLGLVGLPFLWRRSTFGGGSWLVFLLLLTYVLSSWWNWWYGGSFGSRVYVEYLALFALPAALALQHLAPRWKRMLMTCMVLCIVLCQIQTYQMRYYQIHWEDMDKARYWDVFLRLDRIP
ncbi:MAG: hypothetical protein JNL43_01825 [Flavobacteriales bacterium]|nr:hypothetical protein [Flavobacteriales bacterium]